MATTRPTAIPALADLHHDIGGPLSGSLLRDWVTGERTLERATKLLAPFRREGIVGASDASGLSRLSRERDLLEVMWVIAQPKQILHGIGTAIGGRAIGTWVADNTEMFYPATVSADAVMAAMIETQARIAERASVMIGMCLHQGVVYEIGGGLYGSASRMAEVLAEDYARAAETLVTHELMTSLRDAGATTFERREDLDDLHPPGVFTVRSARRFAALREEPAVFPHGFPPDFFASLPTLTTSPQNRPQTVERFVVFVVRERAQRAEDDLAAVLDDFVADALMSAVIAGMVDVPRHVAESGGGLAVLVFEAGQGALDFARRVREKLHDQGQEVKIGIDRGPVLLFARGDVGYDGIVGDPVNLASKISEDLGRPGKISVTDRAAEKLDGLTDAEPFSADISNVHVSGVIF